MLSSIASLANTVRQHSGRAPETLSTVRTVVIAKMWYELLFGKVWPVWLGVGLSARSLTCSQAFGGFWLFLLVLSAVPFCVAGLGLPGFDEAVGPNVAMLIGWIFKTALTECHDEISSFWLRLIYALSLPLDLDLDGALDFCFALGATLLSALIMHVAAGRLWRK